MGIEVNGVGLAQVWKNLMGVK